MVRKTNEMFEAEVKALVGSEYRFLSPYKSAAEKIAVTHMKDNCNNHTYFVSPNNFLRGKRCPKCAGLCRKTTDSFKEEVYGLEGDAYIVLGEYTNARAKIMMLHNVDTCRREYSVTPDAFLRGQRCSRCNGGARKTLEYFKEEISLLVNEEYTVVSDQYVNSHTKLLFTHNLDTCGCSFYTTPTSFLSGSRCPMCNQSKGEKLIRDYMMARGKHYLEQVTFSDLKLTAPLIYDGYLPDEDVLIEYQGIQHYEPVKHFGGESALKVRQERDNLKRAYAKDNGLTLVEVPYTITTEAELVYHLYINYGL